ncbi:MAG: outer membrane beta-barrel protein [Proteobacteria bacterium]|nr:outer membrane beta-barrel protein [Pseudomonadota bacterium]
MKKKFHTLTALAVGTGICLLSAPLAFSAESQPAGSNPPQEATPGTSSYSSDKIFGSKGGFIHPFMSVSAVNSDNINNTKDNEISDWSTIYSPGIWLALPRSEQTQLDIVSSNTAPGGRQMFMDKPKSFNRYQGYAFYGADIEEYHTHTERNTVKQAAVGYFQYNLRGGLSIDVYNKYVDSEDPIGTGDTTEIDAFKNNLAGMMVDYDLGTKFNIRADYTHFRLSYDLLESRGKNRDDNSYSGYLFYKYSPKTNFFAQYEFVNVAYDTNTIEDNDQHHYSLGIQWKPTEKTRLRGKVGVVDRNSDNNSAGDNTEPSVEIVANHQLTEKTGLQLLASQKVNESTVSTASYSNDTTVSASVLTQFTEKIGASVRLSYTKTDFQENVGALGRTDDIYSLSPSLRYMFKEWLMADLGYEYSDRDSTRDGFDYATNKVFVRLSSGF